MIPLLPAACPSCQTVVFVDNVAGNGLFSVGGPGGGLHVHAADGMTIKGSVITGGMSVGGPAEPGADAGPDARNSLLVTCPECQSPDAQVLPGLYDVARETAAIVAGPSWSWDQLDELEALWAEAAAEEASVDKHLEALQSINGQLGLLLMEVTNQRPNQKVAFLTALGTVIRTAGKLFTGGQ